MGFRASHITNIPEALQMRCRGIIKVAATITTEQRRQAEAGRVSWTGKQRGPGEVARVSWTGQSGQNNGVRFSFRRNNGVRLLGFPTLSWTQAHREPGSE